MTISRPRRRVAITGAHGVGKTTFCAALLAEVRHKVSSDVSLSTGLGPSLRAAGVPLGSSSNSDTIAAVFAAHLERERKEYAQIILLERCAVDAIAYTRALRVTSAAQDYLFEELGKLMAQKIDLLVHLELSNTFLDKGASHETPALRSAIADLLPTIATELKLPTISVDAADRDALDLVVGEIRRLVHNY